MALRQRSLGEYYLVKRRRVEDEPGTSKKRKLQENSFCDSQSPLSIVPRNDRHLPLPSKYEVLSEKFHCTDVVVGMFQKRNEICTFLKLKKAVQEMTRRYL